MVSSILRGSHQTNSNNANTSLKNNKMTSHFDTQYKCMTLMS